MKTRTKTLLCITGLIILPLALSAVKDEATIPEHILDPYTIEDLTLPIPELEIQPRLNGQFVGQKVRMKLTVGTDGRARNISQDGISPDQLTNDLVATLQMVLRQWRFKPARDKEGNPVAVKVILPVEVVEAEAKNQKYAAVALAEPIFLAGYTK